GMATSQPQPQPHALRGLHAVVGAPWRRSAMSYDEAARHHELAVLEPGPTSAPHYDAVLGTVVEATPGQDHEVEFEGADGEIVRRPAISTVAIDRRAVGHPVVLMFVGGDLDRPVITGRVEPGRASPPKVTRTQSLVIDGRELVVEAEDRKSVG